VVVVAEDRILALEKKLTGEAPSHVDCPCRMQADIQVQPHIVFLLYLYMHMIDLTSFKASNKLFQSIEFIASRKGGSPRRGQNSEVRQLEEMLAAAMEGLSDASKQVSLY
jgi:hypothetical protein